MGMIIEFNWFMVVANENKILEEQENLFYTIKSEKRIYPIGFQIPLIVKETRIYFNKTESFDMKSAVATHYYERYLDFKKREKEINP